VDALAGDGAEEGQVVGRHVDRPSPRPLDPRRRKTGQEPTQATLRSGRRRAVAAETLIELAAEADRPDALPMSTRPSVVVRQ
jgi:hypothetical protein